MKHVFWPLAAAILCMSSAESRTHTIVTPGFSVSVGHQAWITVHYRGIPVVTGSNFSIAKPGWKGNVFPNPDARARPIYRAVRERDGDVRRLTLTGRIAGAAESRISIQTERQQVRISNEYVVEPNPDVGYVYTECFLSKGLVEGATFKDDAGNEGTLRAAGGEGVPNRDLHRITLITRFGALHISMVHQHTVAGRPGAVAWSLRNVCDRSWGPEDRRTFSIPNVFEMKSPSPLSGRTEYLIRFEPNEAIEKELAARRAELAAQREGLATERESRLAACRQRLANRRGILLVPTPQEMKVREGDFNIGPDTRIVIAADALPLERRPGDCLAEELRDYFGTSVPIVRESRAGSTDSRIVIGGPSVAGKGRLAGLEGLAEEGYVLDVAPNVVTIAGRDVRGAWYGVQALLQLLRWEKGRLAIPCVHVRDWPDFKVRAMMLTLGVRDQMGFLRHTLRRVLPRMRMNMVFIGGASLGKVRWPSHPEMAYPNAFTPEDIRELADLARANFIEPVPHVQGFGHTGPLKQSHPELLVPGKGRQPCFDITKPQARAFVFDIYGDAIDAFRADRYFHVGFDEAQGLQLVCHDRDPAEIVATHITAVSEWLAKRQLRVT